MKPSRAMFVFDKAKDGIPGCLRVVDYETDLIGRWECALGACVKGWRSLTDEEVYQAMHWVALEIAEFSGIPVRMIRDQMELVDGYIEYANRIGAKALGQ